MKIRAGISKRNEKNFRRDQWAGSKSWFFDKIDKPLGRLTKMATNINKQSQMNNEPPPQDGIEIQKGILEITMNSHTAINLIILRKWTNLCITLPRLNQKETENWITTNMETETVIKKSSQTKTQQPDKL